ncbi:hypothetical protein [Streptomyces sp. NPDC001876]|uniref:hypothetical protein n=1 Tax=Streptomyces sp. NPDC001876 TaxID=3154402 RepID=UPI003326F310
MADTIRVTERRKQHLTAAWATPLTMIPASAVGYLTMIHLDWYGGIAVLAVLLAFALRRIYRSKGSSWATGAAGERRTARILLPLVLFGFGPGALREGASPGLPVTRRDVRDGPVLGWNVVQARCR